MKIIRMTGGLGNQMFQYALYLKYINMGLEASFEDFTEYDAAHSNRRPIQLDVFGINYPKVDMDVYYQITDSYPGLLAKIKRKLFGRHNLSYSEKQNSFDEKVLDSCDAYVMGYFQSEKYFESVKDNVLDAFTFTKESIDAADKMLEENGISINEIDDTSVSIHIRRGDYLAIDDLVGGICTEEYYDHAVNYIINKIPKARFYIFTNDTDYAKGWIKQYTDNGVIMDVFEGTTEDTGYIDMYLMSRCHHHIIANSSFSWWGSYLNKKDDSIIIAPKRWINGNNNEDIYTKDMIRL